MAGIVADTAMVVTNELTHWAQSSPRPASVEAGNTPVTGLSVANRK